jgi:CCR4-NOT transcription complex subunit 1
MLEILANPNKHPELTPDGIAHLLRELLTPPTPAFLDKSEVIRLSYAARTRYKHTSLPPQIINVTEPLEHLHQQESLANILQQYGQDTVRLPEHFRELLRRKWNAQVTEEDLADVLVVMATSQNPSEWQLDSFIQSLEAESSLSQNFDWAVVIGNLDREDFIIDGPAGLNIVINAIHQGTRNPEFPIYQLWSGRWKHPRSQWSVLRAYIKADELDVTKELGLRKVFSSDDFATANNALKLMVATFETHKLISYDAIHALLHLALDEDVPHDVRAAVQQELDRAAKFTPELVLCGALMIPPPWSSNLENIIESLFDIFFDGHPSHQMIFWRLWQMDKTLIMHRFIDSYRRNPLTITRILDISQELRCLSELLVVPESMFVLDVASLAARREYLNLEKWLQEMITQWGSEFWSACYRFLRMKAEAEYLATREGGKVTMVNLRVGPVHTFLTVLDSRYVFSFCAMNLPF